MKGESTSRARLLCPSLMTRRTYKGAQSKDLPLSLPQRKIRPGLLLATGITDHLDIRHCQMTVFGVIFLHRFLGALFHVMQRLVGNDTRRSHSVTDMLGKIHLVAPYLPGAAVIRCNDKLLRVIPFRQAAGDVFH